MWFKIENGQKIHSHTPIDGGIEFDVIGSQYVHIVDGQLQIDSGYPQLIAEQNLQYVLNSRRNEYPPITDYLDGVVKGDQAQIDAYIAACQAVKAKYPKPE